MRLKQLRYTYILLLIGIIFYLLFPLLIHLQLYFITDIEIFLPVLISDIVCGKGVFCILFLVVLVLQDILFFGLIGYLLDYIRLKKQLKGNKI